MTRVVVKLLRVVELELKLHFRKEAKVSINLELEVSKRYQKWCCFC